ncbi:MAG: putative quinol monooxygenase [Waddliaceae bacterium]
MMTKSAVVTVRAKPGKEKELKNTLSKFVIPSRNESGCIDYHILQSFEDPNMFIGFMIYENEEAFRRHEASEMIQHFVKTVAPELLEDQPNFKDWRDLG